MQSSLEKSSALFRSRAIIAFDVGSCGGKGLSAGAKKAKETHKELHSKGVKRPDDSLPSVNNIIDVDWVLAEVLLVRFVM